MLIPLSKADTCPPRENKKLNKFLSTNLLIGSDFAQRSSVLAANFYFLDKNMDGKLSEREIAHLVTLRTG